MPRTYPRAERVEKLAREVLGEALLALRDPRVGFATVTSVKLSPDLRQARVYVSVLGSEEARAVSLEAIRHAVPRLRSALGQEVRLKFLPTLEILEDTTAAYGERIERLLREAGVSHAPAEGLGSDNSGAGGGAPEDSGAGGGAPEDSGAGGGAPEDSGAGGGAPEDSGAGGGAPDRLGAEQVREEEAE